MSEAVENDPGDFNVALHLTQARIAAFKRAVSARRSRRLWPRDLCPPYFQPARRESDRLAHGLQCAGIGRGTRTILMVRPALSSLNSSCHLQDRCGAVVVDPGMGIRRISPATRDAPRPSSHPRAHALRILFPSTSRPVRYGSRPAALVRERELKDPPWVFPGKPFKPARTGRDEAAAILFTRQYRPPRAPSTHTAISTRSCSRLEPISISGPDESICRRFRLRAFLSPLGVTAVVPDMDPTRRRGSIQNASSRPLSTRVTNMLPPRPPGPRGGPTAARGDKTGLLKRVISAGAPVQARTIELFAVAARRSDITHPTADEAFHRLDLRRGDPVQTGPSPTRATESASAGDQRHLVRLIAVSDDARVDGSAGVPQGEIGEIASGTHWSAELL